MLTIDIEVKRLHKLEGDGKLKGFADIAIANLLLIKGLRIVEGKNGLFVGMPRRPGKDGQWYPSVFPLNDEVKAQLNEVVLQSYQTR